MKRCAKCGEVKPLDAFLEDRKLTDGRWGACKDCVNRRRRLRRTNPHKPMTLLEKFNSKIIPVPESGCWLWGGKVSGNGYGSLKLKGGEIYAHRFSWEVNIGPIPSGLQVLHKCDVPMCVNPNHLFIGTNKDNMDDKVNKGRQTKKLSKSDIKEIIALTSVMTSKTIAGHYKVTVNTIEKVRSKYRKGAYDMSG